MEPGDFGWLLADYTEDAKALLDAFEARALALDPEVGHVLEPARVNDLLGLLHTFKGNSGMMGLTGLQDVAHRFEGVLEAEVAASRALEVGLVELCLLVAAGLRGAITGLDPAAPVEPDLAPLREALAAWQAGIVVPVVATEAPAVPVGVAAPAAWVERSNVLKVDFQRLDQLMNLMGELVIHRTRLGQVTTQVQAALGERGVALDLSDTAEQIGKVTTELHEAIMRVRMVPLQQVLARFPRFIRDSAQRTGKAIEFAVEGGDTELDKTVIDEIGEPLVHLIRNAIDHGIESPAERLALGKPRAGTVKVRAFQESSHILIQVEDDGRGLDTDAIVQRARASGVSVTGLDRRGIFDLIFLPGLSTVAVVTEYSGRGVGMDVVRKSVAKIGGTIDVESEPHVGTRFIIKLPLTLAIISALMVRVGSEPYAVPLSSVLESLKLPSATIHGVNHREVVSVRGRILPLVRLGQVFRGDQAGADGPSVHVVVVTGPSGELGLVVDALLGQQEIVIKALDDYLGQAPGISGATILGDGRVVLIVDVPTLLDVHGGSVRVAAELAAGAS